MVIKTIWAIRKKSSESDYGSNEAGDALIIVPRDPSNSPGLLLITTFHRTMAPLSQGAQIEQGAVTGPMTRH